MVRAPIRSSRLLAASLVFVHSAAAATLVPLDVAASAKALLLILLAASAAHAVRRHALLCTGRSVIELEMRDREHACVRMRAGGWREATVLGTSCVTPTLTAINLRVKGLRAPAHVLLVGDNVDCDDFRKIRVILRWARSKGSDDAAAPF